MKKAYSNWGYEAANKDFKATPQYKKIKEGMASNDKGNQSKDYIWFKMAEHPPMDMIFGYVGVDLF